MIKVCELFAGVGGFRLGLEKASGEFNFVWANQWEPGKKVQHAFDCYVSHFGKENHVNSDISKIDKNEIPDHDLLVGGFPCQDYSVASTGAKGIQGKKGVLWWEIRDILEAKKPRFVLLENVDRLLKSPAKQRGRDFGVMLACFNELDYSVEWRIINAAEYGFSQRRRRIFIFAFRNDTEYAKKIDRNNLREWIHETGFFQEEFPIMYKSAKSEDKLEVEDTGSEQLSIIESDNIALKEIAITKEDKIDAEQVKMEYDDILEISDNFKMEFKNTGIMTNGVIYTEKTIPRYNGEFTLLRDILERDVDEKYYLDGDAEKLAKWEYLKGAKKIPRTSKTGHSYIFSEGPLAFPDSIDKPSRTMLTSESSVNRSTHVVRDPQTDRLRLLTPIEAERLNGFEDNWTSSGMTEKFRYFCMGNALVVGLVEKMGKSINSIVEKENTREISNDYVVDMDKQQKEDKQIIIYCQEILDTFDKISALTSKNDFNKIIDVIKYYQANILNLSNDSILEKMSKDIELIIKSKDNKNDSISDEIAITK